MPKEGMIDMQITFQQIFKHSDVLNPVSPATLLLAGNVSHMNPNMAILDLGCGKGYPSLLWASVFGVHVKGVDFNQAFVDYANSRAELLDLSRKTEYVCHNLKDFKTSDNYDIVASLGLDLNGIYGCRTKALQRFKNMLKGDGMMIVAEPVWLQKPIPDAVLKALRIKEDDFVTIPEMEQLIQEHGFVEIGRFLSSVADWELYVRPLYASLQEIRAEKPELAQEAQGFIDGFQAEYENAGKFWNMALWVIKQA